MATLATPEARGQQSDTACALEVRAPGVRTRATLLPEGGYRIDAPGPVEAICGSTRVRADSGTYYMSRGEIHLFGNVRYRDPGQTLDADRAVYYTEEERVHAQGNVRLIDRAGGSTLTGPVLHYYPRTETRAVERAFAPNRPHLTFYPEGSGTGAVAFDIDADRLHLYGDSALAGSGDVVAVREDLTARGDSLDISLSDERLWLLGTPSIEAGGTILRGDTILGILRDDRIEQLRAWLHGSAIGDGLSLRADRLRLLLEEDRIVRIVASMDPRAPESGPDGTQGEVVRADTGIAKARSESDEYVLTADSIDIERPGGQLDRLIAVGGARAVATEPAVPEDTLFGRDWIVGDTITGHFEPAQPDSSVRSGAPANGREEVELRRLVASGNARALYHIQEEQPDAGEAERPGLNYVIGRIVILTVEGGQAREARVIGPGTGLYLEPLPGPVPADTTSSSDSTAVTVPDPNLVPDSTATPSTEREG